MSKELNERKIKRTIERTIERTSTNRNKKVLAFMVLLSMFMTALIPGVSLATEPLSLQFASYSDSTLSTGVPETIFFNVYRDYNYNFTGTITASITNLDGTVQEYAVAGTQNPYSIANVSLSTAGTYTLNISDKEGNTVTGILSAVDSLVRTFTSGTLTLDTLSTVTVKLTDLYGSDLGKKAVTIDGSGVGANPAVQNFTTLNDGTFTFSMTPTQEGVVKVIYAGDVVKTIELKMSTTPGARIGGLSQSNAELSIEVARAGWKSAENVILTRDDMLSDAMVAVPLAKKLDAPILMTARDSLDPAILAHIQALSAQTVYIIGGTAAVSAQTESELQAHGYKTERLAGFDRYGTAAAIAEKVGPADTVYLASGYGEPDALAASAPAALQGIPILLSDVNEIPGVTAGVLDSLKPQNIKLLGGTAVISKGVEDKLGQEYSVERWGGIDRYATEQIILDKTFVPDSPVYFTSALVTAADVNGGRLYGDALLTAALAAKNKGFVITLPSSESGFSLSTAPYFFLLMNKNDISEATVVGNKEAISPILEDRLNRLLAE
ncbi:cell wall-binding repeat-containing protein [Paradesulfitobacterium aromaticivorans]